MPTAPSSGRRDSGPPRPTTSRVLRTAPVLLALPLLALVGACGGPDHSGASQAVEAFQKALAGDPSAACGLLSERTRSTLEDDEEAKCEDAITGLYLPEPSPVRKADVYGGNARVMTDGDVLFLARFNDGWKVMAAGCEPQGPDEPYDCVVSGG